MSKLQHTPAPWWNSGLEIGTAPMMDIKTAKADGMNYNNAIANARLIAAAPEMLDVLIGLYKLICLKSGANIKELAEVIEKATGLTIEEVLSE